WVSSRHGRWERRAQALRRRVAQRARSLPGSVVRLVARWKNSGRRRLPREQNLLAGRHAGAMLARDLHVEQIGADRDVELERIAVTADAGENAGKPVGAVVLLSARRPRHFSGAEERNARVAEGDGRRAPGGANRRPTGDPHYAHVPPATRNFRRQQIRV